jgi:hypothetical protein
MGRKKACFGREDYVCLTKDCPYMNDCIQAVWEKKVSGLMRFSKDGRTVQELKSGALKGARK